MPIHTEPISEVPLESLAEVEDWIHTSQKDLQRIGVRGLIDRGGRFREDEYFGDGDVELHFNQHGFEAFCHRLGFRFDQLQMLETPSLGSQVLNDLIGQREVREKLDRDEFVLDERTGTVIGIVSNSYVTYNNEDFLKDIRGLLTQLPKEDDFRFHEGYGVNTELTVRFTSPKHHGTIEGRGGRGDDRTDLGLEFKNSMVGTSSVRFDYFLHRLICANGLTVPAGSGAINRVFHSGRERTFHDRMQRAFHEVFRKLDHLAEMLETLGSIPFIPDELAKRREACARFFEIIPGAKFNLGRKHKLSLSYPQDATTEERREMQLKHDSTLLGLIPHEYGGESSQEIFKSRWREQATLFDFLNVFTEYAKKKKPAERLGIQERAGSLAKYIADNSRKF